MKSVLRTWQHDHSRERKENILRYGPTPTLDGLQKLEHNLEQLVMLILDNDDFIPGKMNLRSSFV